MYRVILRSAAAAAFVLNLQTSAQAVEVYFFKGAGDFSFVSDNLHFSRGLNQMAEALNAEGIYSEVRRFGAVDDALQTIRRRKPESIALVGHSMGALASMSIARTLKAEGIRIAYMGLIDIPGPVGVAGDNVEWAENYYSIHPVYGRFNNVDSHPRASNIHVSGFIHNRMDDSPRVQQGMLTAIRQVHATEQQFKEEAQPEAVFAGVQPIPQSNPAYQKPQMALTYVPPQPENPALQTLRPVELVPQENSAVVQNFDQNSLDVLPQQVDPVTTASISDTGHVPKSRNLVDRASGFLRNLSNRARLSGRGIATQSER